MTDPASLPTGNAEDLRPALFQSSDGTPLFACVHMPTSLRQRDVAVVILPALIYEYERSHRALRALAARLARREFPALRFDYRGCGDSAGDLGPEAIARWEEDTHAAIDHAKSVTNARRIVLVGMRFGSFMTRAVAAREDVCAVVRWHDIDPAAMVSQWRAAEDRVRQTHGWADEVGDRVLGWSVPPATLATLAELSFADRRSTVPTLDFQHTASSYAAADDAPVTTLEDSGPAYWQDESDDALVSVEALETIIHWIEGAV